MKDEVELPWRTHPLASLCERVTVGHVGKTSSHYRDVGVPFLRTQNVGSGTLVLNDLKYVTEEFHRSKVKSRLLPGDVLLTRVVTDEMKCGIVPEDLGEANCANIILVRPAEKLNSQFLQYLIQSPVAQSYLLGKRVGSAQQVVNTKVLKQWPVPLPPLEEQQRIVAVLDEAFEGLARARAHAESNLQNAQELFENILTHTLRHKFEQGKDKLLGDVCELAQGLAINKGTKHLLVEKSSKPLLRIKDLRNNTVEQYVAETGFPPKAAVTADDIIYTRTGQIGLVFRGFEGVLHNNCFSVRTLGDVSQEYLFWWLQEPVFKSEIISLASRAAQPDITHKLFKARSITFPNKDDQASAVELIESAFSETAKLQERYKNKIQDINDLRQSLLQKAFAGELT